jgi:single-stranded DNA-binding protein
VLGKNNSVEVEEMSMSMLNSVLIEGLLVADPETRKTSKGLPMCVFQVVSGRFYREEGKLCEELSHFNIEAYGSIAEICCARGVKGLGVRVVGRLKENGNGGVVIIAEHVEFRHDERQNNIKNNISPCKGCPMEYDCDTEEKRCECGAYRAYLGAKTAKKQSSTKKKA